MSEIERWTELVAGELGITSPVDVTAILDLTKEVAHGVIRPAAPVAAYLLGMIAGAEPTRAAEADLVIRRLASEWSAEKPPEISHE